MQDGYENGVTDEECRRMRRASGRVNDSRPIVALLYDLARDMVPLGTLEVYIDKNSQSQDGPFMFTNGWLAQWAKDAADRIERRNG